LLCEIEYHKSRVKKENKKICFQSDSLLKILKSYPIYDKIVIMKNILLFLLLLTQLYSQEKLLFGVTATTDMKLLKEQLSPLLYHLEKETGRKIEIQSGFDYADTIKKFSDGGFHLGYIGPIPYIKATQKKPQALEIVAGVKEMGSIPFQTAIVVRKDSFIESLADLQRCSFAFGSPLSTLSYYAPYDILEQNNVLEKLLRYDFLGRHDRVAQYVIMGKYDAGALMHSIAHKYKEYLKIIALSQKMPNFSIVLNTHVDRDLQQKIKQALKSFENSDTFGLEEREDKDYASLRALIERVEQ
jgi:phosphonate transport system substrate-binding protein